MLTVTVEQKAQGAYVIYPSGSLNSNTYPVLEDKIDSLLEQSPTLLVLDLTNLAYISSAGIRVVLKTRQALKKTHAKLRLMNLQPQIQKVFDIVNVLPPRQIFASLEEFDAYLDSMQRAVKADNAP